MSPRPRPITRELGLYTNRRHGSFDWAVGIFTLARRSALGKRTSVGDHWWQRNHLPGEVEECWLLTTPGVAARARGVVGRPFDVNRGGEIGGGISCVGSACAQRTVNLLRPHQGGWNRIANASNATPPNALPCFIEEPTEETLRQV